MWPNRNTANIRAVENASPLPEQELKFPAKIKGNPSDYAKRNKAFREKREAMLKRHGDGFIFKVAGYLPLIIGFVLVSMFVLGFFVGFKRVPWR